jgi:hypothetical protein
LREKTRAHRKIKKILIRVDMEGKNLAEKMSKQRGENTSAFFRRLMKEENERETVNVFLNAAERLNNISREMMTYLEMFRKKGIN